MGWVLVWVITLAGLYGFTYFCMVSGVPMLLVVNLFAVLVLAVASLALWRGD